MSIPTNSKEPQVVALLRDELPLAELESLLAESRAEGHHFVDRLVDDFVEGRNRFDQPGEVLFAVYAAGQLVAVGGLNQDPYLPDEDAGRVRHVYVLPAFRRQGAGRLLMQTIIAAARSSHFRLLTLRTLNPAADLFYRGLGFRTEPGVEQATHHLVCQPLTQQEK
jgi:GNAT superfamily N-acetyltransferase